jgi:tripartite ATP-independent transporter DctM subunit
MALLLFIGACLVLLSGVPVAFGLAGASLIFALIGIATGTFDSAFLEAVPNRLYSMMTNQVLMAVPLFVFMGVMLERAKIAADLLETMALLFGKMRGGLGVSVALVGALLAASTGIVGATVITMGLLSLPTMLRHGYAGSVSSGIICASGTLGQIIPPSIVLVLLGDVLSSAYSQAQLDQGIFSPETVSVGDLFAGAILPGLLLVGLYIVYVMIVARVKPNLMPPVTDEQQIPAKALALRTIRVLLPPVLLIIGVLGAIFSFATPTDAAAIGALGAVLIAAVKGNLTLKTLQTVMRDTTKMTGMVFMILIGAAIFSLTFRGFGGDTMVEEFLTSLPGGVVGAMLVVMLVMFLLGFILDFIEITFMVVPIVAPILLAMGLDPVWLGIMIALNLQTSFLTPPFGFSLFYLRGVAPKSITTSAIYRGVVPFILIQLLVLALVAMIPFLTGWLPGVL